MKNQDKNNPQKSDDKLVFADEKRPDHSGQGNASPWKIIIADDQIQVHTLTRMILDGYTFENRGLDLISAFSGSETRKKLQEHPDTAVLLLDVVMETDDAGLEVARYVREDLDNQQIQIVIRTGQAGRISENEIVSRYAINKFAEKTELTAQKIITLITTSLQTYRDIAGQGGEARKLKQKVEVLEAANQELLLANRQLSHVVARTRGEAQKAVTAAEARDKFLATMSHEIRTPLNAIIGMAEMAADTDLDADQQKIVGTIIAEANTLLELVSNFLDFSKAAAGKMELQDIAFDLRAMLESFAASMMLTAENKGLEFTSLLAPDVAVKLIGDPGRLRQILSNLVGNAIKFTGTGEVTLTCRKEAETNNDITLMFTVTDTGIGIPEERQASLFDSYTQGSRSTAGRYGGTGLGTTISRQLVEMMGGQIGFESEEHKGSTFWFSVALRKQEMSSRQSEVPTLNFGGLNVLLVESFSETESVLLTILQSWNCHVSQKTAGMQPDFPEAVVRFAADNPIDLILIDLEIPDIDGFALAREFRKQPAAESLPIIAIKTVGKIGEGRACQDAGFNGYLTRPIMKEELRKAIEMVLHDSGDTGKAKSGRFVTRHSIVENARKDVQILLVEDYLANQQVAMMHLQTAGYDVDLAENGRQAVAAFRHKHYDLILMDMQMPVMDGCEATGAIRRLEKKFFIETAEEDIFGEFQRIPIIAMTANALQGDYEKCIRCGMDDYIAKPLRREKLLSIIDKWVHRQLHQEIARVSSAVPDTGTEDHAPQCVNYDRVIDDFQGDEVYLRKIMEQFLARVPDQLESIQSAVRKKDDTGVAAGAHAIKGSAATLAMELLAAAAYDLESAARDDRMDQAEDLLKVLREEYTRVVGYIRRKDKP